MTIESDLTRIAKALESIAGTLHVLAHPPMMYGPSEADALEQLGEHPRMMGAIVPRDIRAPADASQAYISGTWKRRSGDNIQTAPTPHPRGAAAAPLDPWVRRDVPNVEPAVGQLGIKEDGNGKTTDSTSG